MSINDRYLNKYTNIKSDNNVIKAISFNQDSDLYYEEEYLPIIENCVPNIMENAYMISNYGRVYTFIRSPLYPTKWWYYESINKC